MPEHFAFDHAGRTMFPLDDALRIVLSRGCPLPTEHVPLHRAYERILSQDVIADDSHPPVPLSSRDGWAVAADGAVSRSDMGHVYQIAGEVRAGDHRLMAVDQGQAVRIFTGAPLPPGTDTVIMQEHARYDETSLYVPAAPTRGRWVRTVGSDYAAGQVLLERGAIVRAEHLAILASIGKTMVPVFEQPTVAVLITGDEIVDHHLLTCPPGKIRNANVVALEALITETGAIPMYLGHVGDDRDALKRAIESAPDSHLLLTVGGASVGDYDHVLPVVDELGFALEFTRIAIKPGKPTIFGHHRSRLFIGLPGNPVSCITVFRLLVEPLLKKLAGRSFIVRPRSRAILTTSERKDPDRAYYIPGRIHHSEDQLFATPAVQRESSALMALRDANGLIVLPLESTIIEAGSRVDVIHVDREE